MPAVATVVGILAVMASASSGVTVAVRRAELEVVGLAVPRAVIAAGCAAVVEAVQRRFTDPDCHIFPAAVTLLIPEETN